MPSSSEETVLKGIVIQSTGSWYDVRAEDKIIPSRIRGKFRLRDSSETNPVVVGDRVGLRVEPDGTGLIVSIEERKNRIVRRASGRAVGREHVIMANVDAAWIVQSVLHPKINPGFIDRVIVMASVYGIDVGLVVNKTDLIREEFVGAVEFWIELYRHLGYPVLTTSALTGAGVGLFAGHLSKRTSVLIGPSGVGKSSILNVVAPDLDIRTGEISAQTGKGTHTTTASSLHPLPGGGFVTDTPGLREFGLVELDPEMLSHYFVEFQPYAEHCRYPNCTHDHEPACRVAEAVEADEIFPERYDSYLNMLHSLRQGEKDVGR